MAVTVPYWTMQIERGQPFITTLKFYNNGDAINFDEASIIISPQTGGQVEWTAANGKFTNVSGIYNIQIEPADTLSYRWSSATWRLQVVLNGVPDRSYTSGYAIVS